MSLLEFERQPDGTTQAIYGGAVIATIQPDPGGGNGHVVWNFFTEIDKLECAISDRHARAEILRRLLDWIAPVKHKKQLVEAA